MAHINFLGGLKRQYHHCKTLNAEGQEEYEPAMVLLREELLGRSFWIPLHSMWKYIEPGDNRDVLAWDQGEFDKLAGEIDYQMNSPFSIPSQRREAYQSAAGIVFAEKLHEGSGVLLCTAFSLFKCCQLLELTVGTQTLVQLLMFIQDGLDDLKNMPPAEEENKREIGEITVKGSDGSVKHMAVETTETDQVKDGML